MLKEHNAILPEFEFVKTNDDGTITVKYTNTNHITTTEEISLDRLSYWINRELTTAWYDGYKSAKYEIKRALEI